MRPLRLPAGAPPLAALLAGVALFGAAGALSDESPSWTVSPPRGPADAPTAIEIAGDGLDGGARVALLGGGPFLKGTWPLPEGARSLQVRGDRVFLAYYSHLTKLGGIQILDVTDPARPERVGSFETGDSGVGVASAGNLAYITFLNPYTFVGGLHVVDVDHPGGALRLGTFHAFVDPQAMALEGARAYVADGIGGLRVVDVSDPASPADGGSAAPPGTAHDVAIAAGRAYLAAGTGGLRVYDVSGSGPPVEIGAYEAPDADILSVVVPEATAAGPIAFATDTRRGLLVLGLADPAHPALLATLPLPDVANGLAIDGHFLYAAAGASGIQVIDVADPARPRAVGGRGLIGNTGYFFDVVVRDGEAYVADLVNGLQVIDVRSPASPALAGGADLPGSTLALAIDGDVALAATGASELAVLDLAADGTPAARAPLPTPAPVLGVAAGGGRTLLAAGAAGLLVVEIRGPSGPAVVGAADTPGEAQAVAIADGKAFVADGSRGLAIFDLADPVAPAPLGSLDTTGTARGLAVSGRYAYVADDFRGLVIMDVSSPAGPLFVSRFDTPGRAVGVAIAGSTAFVADLNRGVQVLDLSLPASPRLLKSIGTPGAASGVSLEGSTLLVANGFAGVLTYDVSTPAAPVETGTYDTPGVATGLAATPTAGGTWLVADGPRGVRALRLNPPLPPPAPTPRGILQEIPAGFGPGQYDVMLAGADGAPLGRLPNAFTVCGAGALAAHLETDRLPSEVGPTPSPWRLVVDGDAAWFDPVPRHAARLLLPALPADPIVLQAGGREAIEIRLPDRGGRPTVILYGPDRDAMRSLWTEIAAGGGIPLPRRDARSYGEFRLAVQPGGGAGAPQRYRFEWESGRLTDARAWGGDARLDFEVTAADSQGCDRRVLESL